MVTAVIYTTKDVIKNILSALQKDSLEANAFGVGGHSWSDYGVIPEPEDLNPIQIRVANSRLCYLYIGGYNHINDAPLDVFNLYQNLKNGDYVAEFGTTGSDYVNHRIVLREYNGLFGVREEGEE